jgi:integrase
MNKAIKVSGALQQLMNANSPYALEVGRFVEYMRENGLGLKEGIPAYLASLNARKRRDRKGRMVSYSPSWWNHNLTAVKWSVAYLLDHSPGLTVAVRWGVEQEMKKLKRRSSKLGIAKADRMPTAAEVKTLESRADRRLSLLIRFLEASSCRISEMLGAEIGRARRGPHLTYVTITGKRSRDRDLRLPTSLYDEILSTFQGTTFLFEHDGRKYSRVATTIRIRKLSEATIGKPVTAHLIRHYRGTVLSERFGISKAATELGHTNIATTKTYYDHSRLSDSEYMESIGEEAM